MACSVNLFNLVGGVPNTGGSWTLQSGGPVSFSVNGGAAQTFSNGNTVGSGHLVTIDTVAGTANGTYVFRYSVGTVPCLDTSDVTVTVIDGALAGSDITFTRCNTDTVVYNIFEIISGGNGIGGGSPNPDVDETGVWSGSGTGPAFTTAPNNAYKPNTASPTDDTFQPSLVNMGANPSVTASFTYTVNKGGPPGCTNCQDSATLTFITVLAGNAGNDGSVTLCRPIPEP